jgi:hypothetical protein
MTQEEIQERNKQISLMLGWKESFAHKVDQYGYYQCVEGYSTPWKNTLDEQAVEYQSDKNAFAIEDLQFHSDWNWLMEAVEFIKKNIRLSTDTENAKINELFIDEWEFKVNRYYVRLIQWTDNGWRKFNGKNNSDDLSLYYIIGENCESEKQAVFMIVSDFAKLYNNK